MPKRINANENANERSETSSITSIEDKRQKSPRNEETLDKRSTRETPTGGASSSSAHIAQLRAAAKATSDATAKKKATDAAREADSRARALTAATNPKSKTMGKINPKSKTMEETNVANTNASEVNTEPTYNGETTRETARQKAMREKREAENEASRAEEELYAHERERIASEARAAREEQERENAHNRQRARANAAANAAADAAAMTNAAATEAAHQVPARGTPATVTNVPTLTFHQGNEPYFMNDKHVDGVLKLRYQDIAQLEQQYRQHSTTYPGVTIPIQSHFTLRAQQTIEDFDEITNDAINPRSRWTRPWPALIELLKQMYPATEAAQTAATSKWNIAMKNRLIQPLKEANAPHKWQDPQTTVPIAQQTVRIMAIAREEATRAGIEEQDFPELIRGPIGQDITRAFMAKLRSCNTTWDNDLHKMLEDKRLEVKANRDLQRDSLNLIELQKVIKAKMDAYNNLYENTRAMLPAHNAGSSSRATSINAMSSTPAQQSRTVDLTRSNSRSPSRDHQRRQSIWSNSTANSQNQKAPAKTAPSFSWSDYDNNRSGGKRGRDRSNSRERNGGPTDRYKPSSGSRTGRTRSPSIASNTSRDSDAKRRRSVDVHSVAITGRPITTDYDRHVSTYGRRKMGGGESHPKQFSDCNACGKRHGGEPKYCLFITERHPDVNYDTHIPFRQSVTYHRLQTISQSIRCLEWERALVKSNEGLWTLAPTTKGPKKPTREGVREHDSIVLENATTNEIIDLNSLFSEHKAAEAARREANKQLKEKEKIYTPYISIGKTDQASLLLDSGCIGRDLISNECCIRLKLYKYPLMYPITVTSVHGNEIATEAVRLTNIKVRHEGQCVTVPEINLVVINKGPADIVMGHKSLRENNIYCKLNRYFGPAERLGADPAVSKECTPNKPAVEEPRFTPRFDSLRTKIAMGPKHSATVHISELIPQEPDGDPTEALLPEDVLASHWQNPETKEDTTITFKVHGNEADKIKLLTLLQQYKDVFSTKLSNEPAKVTPMKIDVDIAEFKRDKRSREPTRAQSAARKAAIAKWARQAIADNLIRPSSAEAWSQLLLTPKSNGTWRFTIDFRALNKHTKEQRSPIPNITRLLSTIGKHSPKYFAKMDLTTGFYQTPLDPESMKYTAFSTDFGLFEWTRTAMGLLNSPWYFQGIMEREVFPHLLHKVMEIYIDDLLTWSQNIDELCDNLEKIFIALRKKGMTLNPEKSEFGMSEVEFVGHLIDNTGMTFTPEKLKQVATMPLPTTKGELKSFLGMGGYFRMHLPDWETSTRKLNDILEGYVKKSSKAIITWTDELQQQFAECQKQILECRKLYYEIEGAPIRVYTDASDYGIGAYLCQVMPDGTEIPIEFISKTLTKAEQRWSTYEKEAYAIFYSLRKWEAHLRDVKFTLFTDHKNLTYIAKEPSAKVMRWRLAVQDYSFDIAYIPGEENIIADGFSRLCPRVDESEAAQAQSTITSISSLRSNLENFEEWIPIRQVGNEYEHTEYHIEQENVNAFKTVQKDVAYYQGTNNTNLNEVHKRPHFGNIPRDKYQIIKECHNHTIGHWGVHRTIELVKEIIEKDPKHHNLEWKGMRKDVQSFISRCDCCNKMNEQQLTSHVKKYTTSEYGIMQCIAIDAIYMPKSKSGNKYILTVIDAFTRYTALYAMKDLTAQTAAKTLMNHMCIYGIPVKIQSDNSTEFEAEFRETVEILRIENYRIQAYSHQENGIVERANKEVIRHARNIAYELRKADTWDEDILKIQAIMNEKKSEATGLTPNQIVFAGQINLNAGRLYPQPTEREMQTMSTYMKKQIDYQDKLMDIAYSQQERTNAIHMANSDENEIPHHTGEYIVVRHENGQAPTKLSVRWHGPYRIIGIHKRPQGTVYTCYSPKDGKVADYHASLVQAHPCESDIEAVRSSTLDDSNSYIIEEVRNHEIVIVKAKKTNKEVLNLLIKWHGYKEETWHEINISLKRNEAIQEYLCKHNLQQYGFKENLISKESTELQKKRVSFSSSVKFN